ncbi:beta-ketoacyl-[acyl-carrier-protein] synthase family protein [Chitinophaga pendula]|uniref:beta-ketoacyl-[acyl-carrier-protein] synthase family protein n=1 Tax=Chitinophaga TaxID=79328 RepID=UPI000BAF2F16|nr:MULTISPECIES: beta-ketoacyl-[acyl-carrier-protein] synthase family protein [Chitinophaga]ASZ12175.1 beta-ketoacyl-ACP synthase [Chitinophaga sp. MD30]UCJ04797.1 beta-ketoacyl-[acyl-carrier-protein] synthase family protein [Chitinophaga pendula]
MPIIEDLPTTRVVITGMGVVAPNGCGLNAFAEGIAAGTSGVRLIPQLQEWKQGCQVAGMPEFDDTVLTPFFTENALRHLNSSSIKYGCAAAVEAWADAGLTISKETMDWDTGCIFGTMASDLNVIRELIQRIEAHEYRKMGTRFIEQIMFSGTSAYIAGLLGVGNMVSSNSSACSTGLEAIVMSYNRIKHGYAKRMVAGSSESASPYMWAAADAMGVLGRKSNDKPEAASRPMSATASGFIPAAGGGALILEELETALQRGARIYAEIKGGAITSGGQRNGGTMTAPNMQGVQRCISDAITASQIDPNSVDLICGHLTSTFADKVEIGSWVEALGRKGSSFPYINSLKSMTGHCMGGAGSVESIAAILQLHHQFIHPSINCEDPHPEITALIDPSLIPVKKLDHAVNTVMKASFGFGDVNSCIVFSKY